VGFDNPAEASSSRLFATGLVAGAGPGLFCRAPAPAAHPRCGRRGFAGADLYWYAAATMLAWTAFSVVSEG